MGESELKVERQNWLLAIVKFMANYKDLSLRKKRNQILFFSSDFYSDFYSCSFGRPGWQWSAMSSTQQERKYHAFRFFLLKINQTKEKQCHIIRLIFESWMTPCIKKLPRRSDSWEEGGKKRLCYSLQVFVQQQSQRLVKFMLRNNWVSKPPIRPQPIYRTRFSCKRMTPNFRWEKNNSDFSIYRKGQLSWNPLHPLSAIIHSLFHVQADVYTPEIMWLLKRVESGFQRSL